MNSWDVRIKRRPRHVRETGLIRRADDRSISCMESVLQCSSVENENQQGESSQDEAPSTMAVDSHKVQKNDKSRMKSLTSGNYLCV